MARVCLALGMVSVAAGAASEGIAPKCAALLGGVAASGHSDMEIASFCRAAYPTEMCGSMRSSLGPMPWPEAKIQATCHQWDVDLKAGDDRGLFGYNDFQQTLEASANQKKQIGYQMPRNRDGTLNLDETVRMKLAQTQQVTSAYNQYMGYSTPPPTGFGRSQRLFAAGHGALATAAIDYPFILCGGLAVMVAAGVAAGIARVARVRPQQEEESLVEASLE